MENDIENQLIKENVNEIKNEIENQYKNIDWDSIDQYIYNLKYNRNPALNAGINVFKNKIENYKPKAMTYYYYIKQYFHVDNNYIFHKILKLLFPFSDTSFNRKKGTAGANIDEIIPPVFDINCPDLYLPLMGFSTFVLLSGYIRGLSSDFTPDLMIEKSTNHLTLVIIESIVVYFTLFYIGLNINMFDVISLIGYKYVLYNNKYILNSMSLILGYSVIDKHLIILIKCYSILAFGLFMVLINYIIDKIIKRNF